MKTERKKEKSNLRYFARVTKDLYTIMPVEITLVLLFKVLYAAIAFVQVYATAALFDTAGNYLNQTATRAELLTDSGIFLLLFALPLLLGMIEKPITDIHIFQKHHNLIHRLHARVVSMPLIRLRIRNSITRSGARNCVCTTAGSYCISTGSRIISQASSGLPEPPV